MLISTVWKGSTEKNWNEHIYVCFMVEATRRKKKKVKKKLYEVHLSFPIILFWWFSEISFAMIMSLKEHNNIE